MKIQFFSDIHLEFGDLPLPVTEADLIIAAGDIGVGLAGINWLRRLDKPVVYVAGNHEFYGGDLVHTRRAIASAVAGSAIRYLDDSVFETDGVRFLGATLWTDFMGGNEDYMCQAGEQMNDYSRIRYDGKQLQPSDLRAINARSRQWLAQELARPFDGRTVVVTHHAPTIASWMYHETGFYRAAYCNDLADLLERCPIDLWVHGHVHWAFDYNMHDVRVVCNARGYEGFQAVTRFDATRTIDL